MTMINTEIDISEYKEWLKNKITKALINDLKSKKEMGEYYILNSQITAEKYYEQKGNLITINAFLDYLNDFSRIKESINENEESNIE